LTVCVLVAAAGTTAATLVATTVPQLATAVAATAAMETLSATAVAATAETSSAMAVAATRLLLLPLRLRLLLPLPRLLNLSRLRVLITPSVLRLLTRMLSSFAVPTTRTTTKFRFRLMAGEI
jgi:hypothetical protein